MHAWMLPMINAHGGRGKDAAKSQFSPGLLLTVTWPEVGASRPARTLRKVDFPDPQGPTCQT